MTTGACLCGLIRYEVSAPFKWMAHCHCSMCRKHHGSLYGTTLAADRQQFKWLSGEEHITHYRTSPAFERPFCSQCGSVVPDVAGDVAIIPAGTLDSDPGTKPTVHIFAASKSPMWDITDGLTQFEAYPSGFGTPVPYAPHLAEGETLSGSCLCGNVAFAIDAQPTKITNCHCSRCRRSRSAAHATNTFVRQDALRWVRGVERIKTYKVPEAALFSTSFCTTCGSLLPSLFEGIKNYIVPLGCLDQPLAAKPAQHIYVTSRAPWFDISDSLPQYEEMPPKERIRELMFG